MCFISCTSSVDKGKAREELSKTAQEANTQMAGMDMGRGLTMQSVSFDQTNMIYTVIVDEDYLSISQMKAQESQMKNSQKAFLKSFFESSEEGKALKKNLEALDGSVVYQYVGDVSHSILSVNFPVKEL